MPRMPNASRLLPFLLIAYVLGPQPATAVVDVQGDAASVQVVARQARLSEVLVSLSQAFGIRYETMVNLDTAVDGTYRGPLGDVLKGHCSGERAAAGARLACPNGGGARPHARHSRGPASGDHGTYPGASHAEMRCRTVFHPEPLACRPVDGVVALGPLVRGSRRRFNSPLSARNPLVRLAHRVPRRVSRGGDGGDVGGSQLPSYARVSLSSGLVAMVE
jgi:hypothetical protein